MKLLYETPDEQAGHVEQEVPTETGGPTLSEALASMDPSLTVEPVAEAEEVVEEEAEPSEAEEAPGDEVEETQPGTEELDLEAEAEPEEAEEVEEPEEELELVEEAGTFTLTLGEVELDLEVEDDDTRAALEKMQGDLGRVKDIDQLYGQIQRTSDQNAQDRAALESIEDEMRLDPVGYITDRVHPTIKVELIKELLQDDEVLRAAETLLGEWMDDPAVRREQIADTKVQRIERKREAAETKVRQGQERQNARALWSKVMEITPQDMDHETAKMWHRDAMMEIQAHVQASNIETLNPDDLPRILASRMRLYGIGDNAGRSTATPTDERGKKLAAETGERFKRKVARRRKAASSPVGAGGAPGRTQLPKGATLDDALKELRSRVGK